MTRLLIMAISCSVITLAGGVTGYSHDLAADREAE